MARLIVAGTASRKKRRSIIATRKSVTRERKNSLCVRLAASESRSRVYSASAFLRYLPVSRTVKPRFSHLLFVVFRPKEKRHRVFALLHARFTSPPYILLLYSFSFPFPRVDRSFRVFNSIRQTPLAIRVAILVRLARRYRRDPARRNRGIRFGDAKLLTARHFERGISRLALFSSASVWSSNSN